MERKAIPAWSWTLVNENLLLRSILQAPRDTRENPWIGKNDPGRSADYTFPGLQESLDEYVQAYLHRLSDERIGW